MIPFLKGVVSQQEIAHKTFRDKSSVLRSIISLTNKNLLNTARDPFDKRKKMVQLTKDGRLLADRIAKELIKMDELVFSCLSEEGGTYPPP